MHPSPTWWTMTTRWGYQQESGWRLLRRAHQDMGNASSELPWTSCRACRQLDRTSAHLLWAASFPSSHLPNATWKGTAESFLVSTLPDMWPIMSLLASPFLPWEEMCQFRGNPCTIWAYYEVFSCVYCLFPYFKYTKSYPLMTWK